MEMQLIRSRRKTLCAEIRSGCLIVRAPLRASETEISRFLQERKEWIETHLSRSKERMEARQNVPPLTEAERRVLAREASAVFPERAAFYAGLLGVSYSRITVRFQRTRWGSCSSRGNLNFNCLLLLAPPEVLDSVVVHELCHLRHMDHSPAFYADVLRVFPDYRKWDRWLKEYGSFLTARLP